MASKLKTKYFYGIVKNFKLIPHQYQNIVLQIKLKKTMITPILLVRLIASVQNLYYIKLKLDV